MKHPCQKGRRNLRRKETRRVMQHLVCAVGRHQRREVELQVPEARDSNRPEAGQEEPRNQHHARTRRRSALNPSASSTRRKNVSRIVATSPPASIRSDNSICCPRPPAPTNPITTDARIAHSQRYTL